MENTVVVAIISFFGTLIGTAGGIIASGKLTEYRLEQLEKKVDLHNKQTARIPVLEEKITNITGRINALERDVLQHNSYFDSLQ